VSIRSHSARRNLLHSFVDRIEPPFSLVWSRHLLLPNTIEIWRWIALLITFKIKTIVPNEFRSACCYTPPFPKVTSGDITPYQKGWWESTAKRKTAILIHLIKAWPRLNVSTWKTFVEPSVAKARGSHEGRGAVDHPGHPGTKASSFQAPRWTPVCKSRWNILGYDWPVHVAGHQPWFWTQLAYLSKRIITRTQAPGMSSCGFPYHPHVPTELWLWYGETSKLPISTDFSHTSCCFLPFQPRPSHPCHPYCSSFPSPPFVSYDSTRLTNKDIFYLKTRSSYTCHIHSHHVTLHHLVLPLLIYIAPFLLVFHLKV